MKYKAKIRYRGFALAVSQAMKATGKSLSDVMQETHIANPRGEKILIGRWKGTFTEIDKIAGSLGLSTNDLKDLVYSPYKNTSGGLTALPTEEIKKRQEMMHTMDMAVHRENKTEKDCREMGDHFGAERAKSAARAFRAAMIWFENSFVKPIHGIWDINYLTPEIQEIQSQEVAP